MTDTRVVVAEMRAEELLDALQAAVDGKHLWRMRATVLLDDINCLRLPPLATEALREADARKRAAEMMADACNG